MRRIAVANGHLDQDSQPAPFRGTFWDEEDSDPSFRYREKSCNIGSDKEGWPLASSERSSPGHGNKDMRDNHTSDGNGGDASSFLYGLKNDEGGGDNAGACSKRRENQKRPEVDGQSGTGSDQEVSGMVHRKHDKQNGCPASYVEGMTTPASFGKPSLVQSGRAETKQLKMSLPSFSR